MKKIIFTLSIISLAVNLTMAQPTKNHKRWDAVVIGRYVHLRAALLNVTDSSLILLIGKNHTREINFDELKKIKIKPNNSAAIGTVIGATSFIVGGAAGGAAIGTAVSKGQTGEPAAMRGVVGGIVGGMATAVASAAISTIIFTKVVTRKIYVHHDAVSYEALKFRLKPYCLIQ